ncbi:MAG: 50S ribosomal protein L11 methyltransferase [Alphaproteobacteria bacterium]|nr:50S ribosomal protein L11 methyltransferase [Alphaproteobacteria bacterium]
MTTFTALTTLSGHKAATALGDAMEGLRPEPTGVGVSEVEDGSDVWELGGYFVELPDEVGLALLAAAFGAKPFAVSELPEVDWVAKVRRDLAPVVAGRFFVYGSHDADKVPDDVVPLAIDAALAFGTGHHGTTQGCLMALDRLATGGFVGKNVADIGCGTAVLAMAAVKIWPEFAAIASDIDQIAVDTASANVVLNGLEGRIHCVTCAGFDHSAIKAKAPFDLVFANILKGPLIALAPDMAEAVARGGYVILSGILNTQADEVLAIYQALGFGLDDRLELGEWTTLSLIRTG